MVLSGGSVFSETLQEITNTKLEELSKRRSDFENTKSNILSELGNEKDPIRRLHILNRGVRASLNLGKNGIAHGVTQSRTSQLEIELKNLDCFLTQAKYDPSLSVKMIHTWEESLLRHLEMQSLKYQYASLYAQLVTEWLSTEKSKGTEDDDIAMTEDFEDVASAMKQDARSQWEKTVFEPAQVDEGGLQAYLAHLFGTQSTETSDKLKAINKLRHSVKQFEIQMTSPNQFNASTLKWVADGLLSSDLLPDEKREVLKDFKNNQIILAEVADVLNMRITSLDSWSWGARVPLEQRRKISGVYNIFMNEDLLQALFLQYIGTKWSVFLKGTLKAFQGTSGVWKSCFQQIPRIDLKRREYYLGPESRSRSVQGIRDALYRKYYFMAHLLDHESQRSEVDEGEEEAEYQVAQTMPAQAMATQAMATQARGTQIMQAPTMRARSTMQPQQALFGAPSSYPPMKPMTIPAENQILDDEDNSDAKRPIQSKQRLLRLLSTEIAMNTKLYGEITAFHSMFENWNTLLPHETILTVLSFFGVSTTWLAFFRKFLRAPLKFLEDNPSTPARDRCRGTPSSHVLSDIFGESILFCLDFAVNQSTDGALLFRMHDDFWFWSRDHSVAVTAWKSVTDFVRVTGTRISSSKTGTMRIPKHSSTSPEIDSLLPKGEIRWGFLKLSEKTGNFEIDQVMVDKHIVDLRKQLHDKRKSVISFIQAWNTYAATFFTSNFGRAANCFGQDHVAQMLATHERIQREVFSSSSSLASASGNLPSATNIVEYLQRLIEERFAISDIPDAYFFFPIELGGLDLKSPFISILQVYNTVLQTPAKLLDDFFEAEKCTYNSSKIAFEQGYNQIHRGPNQNWEPDLNLDPNNFMSFNEFVRYREDIDYKFDNNLFQIYKKLMKAPEEKGIQDPSPRLLNGINALGKQGTLKAIRGTWVSMEPYWKWVAQLYGPEAMDRFGGLNIVEPGLLPMGMVSIFRDKRVTWQG
ncbi:hypothetical protein AAE478_008045 [Parahypoxylon ruwenzoriense]